MKRPHIIILILVLSIGTVFILSAVKNDSHADFVTYTVDPKKQNLNFYWKDESANNFRSLGNLKNTLNRKNLKLLFAVNGGMYKKDKSPQGLYIEKGKVLSRLDTLSGNGNFYLMPNGVFFLTDENIPGIATTQSFQNYKDIKYATQSGPMLLVNGAINVVFNKGSKNLNIRNGVGILPNNKILFAMSKKEINFYDFAKYFESLGCRNALYLDGLVSRTYAPSENWIQTDGDFGVILGVTTNIN